MASPATTARRRPAGPSYEEIVRSVRAGDIKPVYYLMGDESYYIDRVAGFIVDTLLPPEERDYNLITLYGPEADVDALMAAAKRYPMGGRWLVIVVKEAQHLRQAERLELYLRQPQPSTVLVLCHKNGTLDRRLKVSALIAKTGVLFESRRLYDSQLPAFVRDYLKRRRVAAEPGAAELVADFVGSDLNRLAAELDKVLLALPPDGHTLTADLVRQHIGQSKNYTVFELLDALGEKNVTKVNQIAKYFDNNPKDNPIQKVLPALFRYFANLMLAYYAPDRSEAALAAWLNQSEWQVRKNVLPALSHYSGVKVMHILSELRHTDARSKGVDNPFTPNGELLRELLFFILH
ncbi:MAG: DNA polymerase III subunit delta [Alloprevotella sp.]